MNEYSIESFINWCDDMTIADEGKFIDGIKELHKIAKECKEPISISKAVKVSNIEELFSIIERSKLIQVPNDMQKELEKKIRAGKILKVGSGISGTISLVGFGIYKLCPIQEYKAIGGLISAISGLSLFGQLATKKAALKGIDDFSLVKADNGKMYLVRKMYRIVERKEGK